MHAFKLQFYTSCCHIYIITVLILRRTATTIPKMAKCKSDLFALDSQIVKLREKNHVN